MRIQIANFSPSIYLSVCFAVCLSLSLSISHPLRAISYYTDFTSCLNYFICEAAVALNDNIIFPCGIIITIVSLKLGGKTFKKQDPGGASAPPCTCLRASMPVTPVPTNRKLIYSLIIYIEIVLLSLKKVPVRCTGACRQKKALIISIDMS